MRRQPEKAIAAMVLEAYPNTSTPIATTLVLAPTISMGIGLAPAPIIGINPDTKLRTINVALPDVPAISFVVANDFRRSCGCCQRESAGRR
jgi:hypothetical protein